MFQFPRFAFDPYVFRIKYLLLISANARSSIKTTSQLQISKVGFPIRKSADQSLFAAPHGLSQRTTSFIASQRQGIHRIPFRHLIALITNNKTATLVEKTSFASNTSESAAVKRRPRLRCSKDPQSFWLRRSSIGCISSSRCQIQSPRRSAPDEILFVKGRILAGDAERLVEPDGIEPTTSCLQSTRSPN